MELQLGSSAAASLVRIQNLVLLAKHLRLPINYKVYEQVSSSEASATRSFLVVVHVRGDQAFKKYLQHASKDDLPLFRGLLLKVDTTAAMDAITGAHVQQAFLPKFENEGQDAKTAAAIADAAGQRYWVASIKHSGSLATLSGAMGFAAKNSLNNTFTAGAALLLRAHYARLCGGEGAAAEARLTALMADLRERRLAVAFEVVTGSHGHHGQLPAAEYLVATAAHTECAPGEEGAGGVRFLPWHDFMALCLKHGLPLNDVWIMAGRPRAEAARQLLDELALRGGPTGAALDALTRLTDDGAADGCLHLPGTYPHEQWQGSRIEGFVIAQGDEVSEAAAQRLHSLRDAMSAQALQLAAVPPHLRSPYADLQASLMAASKPADGGGDGGSGVEGKRGPASDADGGEPVSAARTVAAIKDLCAPWLDPATSAAAYRTAPAAVRTALEKLLIVPLKPSPSSSAAAASGGSEASFGALSARPYSRAAIAAAPDSLLVLEQLLQAAASALQPNDQEGVSRVAAALARVAAVREARSGNSMEVDGEGAAEKAAADELDDLLELCMVALAGPADVSHTLRYKKKMTMWTLPAAPGSGSGDGCGGVMGYCMMTFVIRNGLSALKLGEGTYMGYVEGLARRSWQLPAAQAAQVLHFARCWAAWVRQRVTGGAAAIESDTYLHHAEPFVKAFLESNGGQGMGGAASRPDDAFQGVLMLVDCDPAWAEQLRAALHLPQPLDSPTDAASPQGQQQQGGGKKGQQQGGGGGMPQALPAFTRSMVPGGILVVLPADVPPPRGLKEFLKEAAPFTHVVVMRPPQDTDGDDTPAAKRRKGMLASKVKQIESSLVPGRMLEVRASTPVAEVVAWAGRGSPLPVPDPAVVVCFVTIPGVGKTALAGALESRGLAVPGAEVSVKLLNSDTMKKQRKPGQPDRYWHEVAAAASEFKGGPHRLVVLADKNLVPSPPENVPARLRTINDGGSGAHTLAVFPVCRGATSATRTDAAGLYTRLQALPLPLELITLCMDRVLRREKHEGDLDAVSSPQAASVVAMFGNLCRNMPRDVLVDMLQGNFSNVALLEVMHGDAEGKIPLDVLQHVAQGLRDVDVNSAKKGEPLPRAWEEQARALLARPDTQAALRALELPLATCVDQLHNAVAATLQAAVTARDGSGSKQQLTTAPSISTAVSHLEVDAAAAAAAAVAGGKQRLQGPGGAPVRYIGVFGFDEAALREAATEALQQAAAAAAAASGSGNAGPLASGNVPALRAGALHVTLWHASDARVASSSADQSNAGRLEQDPADSGDETAQQAAGGSGGAAAPGLSVAAHGALGRLLLERIGTSIELEAVALYYSPEVTAAEVTLAPGAREALGLAEGGDASSPALKPFLHVTLAVSEGHSAVESNALPRRYHQQHDPSVLRLPLPPAGGPLVLQGGQVLAIEGS